jgi:hypothetical protein
MMKRILAVLAVGWLGVIAALAQDLPQPDNAVTMVAYQCRFNSDDFSANIRATLQGIDGLPIPLERYTVEVRNVDTGEAVPPDLVAVTPLPQRPPLQMILLLDVTDTMPLQPIINAVSDNLLPQLQVEDRVALVTFTDAASPRTQFYTDKNRLINEYILDLSVREGDNRIYDVLYDAVLEFSLGVDDRQVIVVVTDSGRRFDDQRTVDEIVERADRENVQVYGVGFNSGADVPDVSDLTEIANRTGGYVWVWDSNIISRDAIEAGVGDNFTQFVQTLNSEILINIDLEGQQPDASGFITFRVQIVTDDEEVITDRIACPVEALQHSIAFRDDVADGTIRGPVDILVEFDTDLANDEVVPVFLVNGDVVQDNGDTVFRFNDPGAMPGYYTVGAQLRSRDGQLLATTDRAIDFYVQGNIDLSPVVARNDGAALAPGERRFEVTTDANFDLPPVRFLVAQASNPTDQRRLGDAEPFVNGVALKVVPDARAAVNELFPGNQVENFIVTAQVDGVSPGDPDQAVSNSFEVFIPLPEPEPTVGEERQGRLAVLPINALNFSVIPWGLTLVFLLVNVMLFRSVGRSRVRRLINRPDNWELPAQLMMLTIRREGLKHQHTLTKKTINLGRGTSNDINLGDDPNISRNHGVIMYREGEWWYSNCKRRAVVRINGKRKMGYVWQHLTPITEIEIGNTLLVFHSSAQKDVSELVKTNL